MTINSELNARMKESDTWSKEDYEDLSAMDHLVIGATGIAAGMIVGAAVGGVVWGAGKIYDKVYYKIQGRRFVRAMEAELEETAK